MKYFNDKPVWFRIFIIFTAVILLTVSWLNFYRNVSSPTDENVYINVETKIYVTKPVHGIKGYNPNKEIKYRQADMIKTGDFIYAINGMTNSKFTDSLEIYINKLADSSIIQIIFLNVDTLRENISPQTLFTRKSLLPNDFYRNLKSVALIYDVSPGGASSRAGIKIGDIITKVNNNDFTNVFEADRYLRFAERSGKINYNILRNNKEYSVDVKLALFGIQYQILLFSICGYWFIGFGLFLGLKRPQYQGIRYLSLGFLFIGFLLTSLQDRFQMDLDFLSVSRMILIFGLNVFGYAFLLISWMYFPSERPELIKLKRLTIVPLAYAGFYFLVNLSNLIINIYYKINFFNLPNIYGVIFLLSPLLIILYMFFYLIKYRKYLTPELKKRKKPLMLMAYIFLGFGLIFLADNLFFSMKSNELLNILFSVLLFMIPFVYLYVIGRNRLYGLTIRVRRNIQYVFAKIGWNLTCIILLIGGLWLISKIDLKLPNVRMSDGSIEVISYNDSLNPLVITHLKEIIPLTPTIHGHELPTVDSLIKEAYENLPQIKDIPDVSLPSGPKSINRVSVKIHSGKDSNSVVVPGNESTSSLLKNNETFIIIILSVIWAFLLFKISKIVRKIIDKLFYRTGLDYKKAATEFLDIFANNLTIPDLAEGIVKNLYESFHLKNAGVIVLPGESEKDFDLFGIKNKELIDLLNFNKAEIIKIVRSLNKEISITNLKESFVSQFYELGINYLMPIHSKGKASGALLLGEKLSEKAYTSEDFDFLRSVASQSFIAIENSLLYESLASQERIKHELELARRIQLASLPQKVPEINGLDISGVSVPAFEVGGDFYDFLNGKTGILTVVVGDVSGKGTSAALYMSKVQGIMRTLNEFSNSPKDLLVRTNMVINKYLDKSSFITAIGAEFDTVNRRILIARAGHLPLYVYRSDNKEIEKLIPKGIVLGMGNEELFSSSLTEIAINYTPGDVFLFVTDGIIEARNMSNDEFSETRLSELLLKNHEHSAQNIRDEVIEAVREFAFKGDIFDDMSVIVIKAD